MDIAGAEDAAEQLQQEIEGLRTVAVGDSDRQEYEVVYMRDDIAELYDEGTRDEIFRDVLLERIAEEKQEDLFQPLGELEFTVRAFEGGVNVLAWSDTEALFVGTGPYEEEIPTVMETARDFL